ncbi:hypothetical protein JCM10207_003169 [Rhodosporidiobolus poonsookiae]
MTSSASTPTQEKPSLSEESDDKSSLPGEPALLGDINKSSGVRRIEIINEHLTPALKAWTFIGVFFVAYCYNLDYTVRNTLQSYATSSFSTHSLLSTVNVLRSIVAAACYPAYAKIADTFGRIEMMLFCTVLYVVGTIVEATSSGIKSYCAGAVIFQAGYSAAVLVPYIVIGDLTSLRSRVLVSVIPYLPYIINTWASGNIVDSISVHTSWNVGIGIWAAVFPFCVLIFLVPLWIAERRAKKSGRLEGFLTPFQQLGVKRVAVNLFWELDVIGSILIIAVLTLILLPFTLAGGTKTGWTAPHNLAMLIVGVVVALPALILWEKLYARAPAIPVYLMRSRTILGCFGISILPDLVYYLTGEYLYTVLVVGFNESILSATRIVSVSGFTSTLVAIAAGTFIRFVPRVKLLILAGMAVYIISIGMMIRFRGHTDSHAGIIASQVLLGLSSGLFPFAAQVLVQVEGTHQHMAILLATYRAVGNIGSAVGQAVGGAIWTQILPAKLEVALNHDMTEVAAAYGDPFRWVYTAPWGTPQREAVVAAYSHVQKLLCIAGICFCIPLVGCALVLKDYTLTADQSLPDAEAGRNAKTGEIISEAKL